MIRMLLACYSYGFRQECRLCQEVVLILLAAGSAKLDPDDKVPKHSTFSVDWLGRLHESEVLRHISGWLYPAWSLASSRVRGSQ